MGNREGALVSVVVPTYNRIEHLQRAVESVAEQTYEPIELLVVDDCSDVPVAAELDCEYDGRIDRFEVLRHEKNRGGSAARNTGIRAAEGEYVALLDDDDRWEPRKVERQVERLQEGDVGLVFTGGRAVDGSGRTISVARAPDSMPSGAELTKRLLCTNIVGSCTGVMVDRSLIEAAGAFDERFPSWQDQEWYVRLSRYCDFGTVEEPLFVYSAESPNRVSEDVEALKDETYPLYVNKFHPLATEYGRLFGRKMEAWAAYRVGKALVMADEFRTGRAFLERAVTQYPFEPAFYKYLLPSLGGRSTYETARRLRHAFD